MLVKKDVLIFNGQKLVQGMQVHKQLMLQIMTERIAAHHLLGLFIKMAVDKNQWLIKMERMRGILNQNEFDEELVHELIKRIYVGMDNSVEVEFKCSDPYQEVLAIMSEVQNE